MSNATRAIASRDRESPSFLKTAFSRLEHTAISDATTILNFRRLLEENELAQEMLTRVNRYLSRKGLWVKGGSIVDATIIAAPSSTKKADGERDPEMQGWPSGRGLFRPSLGE